MERGFTNDTKAMARYKLAKVRLVCLVCALCGHIFPQYIHLERILIQNIQEYVLALWPASMLTWISIQAGGVRLDVERMRTPRR